MTEAPEFPQADPAIRYIVEKVSQIENQYACNAQYHKDHKAIKQRLDNLDPVISELRKITSELKNTPRAKDINDIVSALAERSKKQNDKLAKETALINDKFAEFNKQIYIAASIAERTAKEAERNQAKFMAAIELMNQNLKADCKDIIASSWARYWTDHYVKIEMTVFVFLLIVFGAGYFIGSIMGGI